MNDHELVSARFTDNEKTIVEAIVNDPQSDEPPYAINIEAKDGDPTWDQLLKQITIDQLHENTVKSIRASRDDFEAAVKSIAEKEGLTLSNLKQDEVFNLVIDTILSDIDEESLFKFKLKIFDHKTVKDVSDRGIKAEIRKAKSISEVIAAFVKI